MMLCGMIETERIVVHPDNRPHESHWIDITKDKDAPVFYVTNCCNTDWSWDFCYSKTNYDIVKHLVVDCALTSHTMDELLNELDESFTDICSEMVYYDDEMPKENWECDGDCDNCEFDVN